MNIRKRLALAAAVALPVSGLVVIGGAQVASAGGPPVLSCASLGADPQRNRGSDLRQRHWSGHRWLGPGCIDLVLCCDLTGRERHGPGSDVVTLPNEAIAGQTLTLANSQVVTVVSDTFAHTGVASTKNFETAVITPAASSAIAKKAAVTINPSTTGTYQTYSNATID